MSDNKTQSPKGVHDVLPKDDQYMDFVYETVRSKFQESGFQRIRTPIFEFTDIFKRPLGEDTDIVEKEIYSFVDKGGNNVSLRPEFTAGVCRAFVQHGMTSWPQPVRFWDFGPAFRYDRPQKGRYRQFYQINAEVMGELDAAIDAQLVYFIDDLLKALGLEDVFTVQVNSLGSLKCRKKYVLMLQEYYAGKERNLCDNCKKRLARNPLRLLDCKHEDCAILAQLAPKLKDSLDDESRKFQEDFLSYLTELNISYVENPQLVRGLDYYTRTVFEFWDKTSGAQNAIGGGGRYDGLIELLGGQSTPAVGFALGVERIINNMKDREIVVPDRSGCEVYIAQLGPEAKKKSLAVLVQLRDAGISTTGCIGKASMTVQLRHADKLGARYCVIIGEREVMDGTVIVRDMTKGTQETIKMNQIATKLKKKIK